MSVMNSDQPELYSLGNAAQRDWAKRTWQWFISHMTTEISKSRFNSVIDFGCGTGEITASMPMWISNMDQRSSENSFDAEASSSKLIVGMDICPKMIEYCRSHYLKSESNSPMVMEFVVADAGDPSSMKPTWRSMFDFLYSFTAMHWVPDQRKVLQSFRFCLKDGGLALLLLPINRYYSPWIQCNRIMEERWSEYLSDFSEDWKRTPAWTCEVWGNLDPAIVYNRLAADSGFHVLHSEVQPIRYEFGGETTLEAAMVPITPYLPRIPEEKRKQFIEEMAEEYRKLTPREMGQDGEYVDVINLEILTVVLRKSVD